MARCQGCSAPLPVHSQHCRYCGIRNDMDLHAHAVAPLPNEGQQLNCPECEIALDRVSVGIGDGLEIGHCSSCYGMFFSPGGVEYALSEGVSNADRVRMQQIDQVNQDRFQSRPVRYRFCPVCHNPMRRFNFGQRSGVIVDQCVRHGVWLDNGELIHLLEWRKSGGHLLKPPELSKSQTASTPILPATPARSDSLLTLDLEDLIYSAVDRLTGLFR